MMNYSKRSDGRRLLLVIALFGILSAYGITAVNNQVTDAASTEESAETAAATAAGDQSTVDGLAAATETETTNGGLAPTAAAAGAETTSETEKVTETSAGETAAQPGETTPGGTGDEQTGSTVGGSSITEGEGTVEAATSDGKFSTADGVSSVRIGGGEAGVESSAGRTEGGTTATVKEAPSSAGSTETEKQITEIGVLAGVTGAPSTNGTEEAPLGAIQQDGTTGTATAEESTTSVVQTSIAADAQYTTNMGDTSAERHTETPVPVKVTVIAVSSTLAPIGCNSTNPSCEVCQNIPIADSPTGPVQWKISATVWEAAGKYYYSVAFQHQSNSSQRGAVPSTERSPKLNCAAVVKRLEEALGRLEIHISSTPLPSTTSAPERVPIPGSSPGPGPERRRRRAAETTSAPRDRPTLVLPNIQLDDILRAVNEAIDVLTNDSNENPTSALPSSPQSTERLAESGIASDTTSNVLTSTSTVSAKAEDPNAVKEPTQTPGQDVWDAHRGIFLTVAILISVCVVVTAFCCLCMKWRERGGSRNPEKHPIAMEEAREAPTAVSNPITDREMIQDEAPMQERENPAVTPNGGGQHISKADEDNGWVVPLDELSNAEKEKPEVENTRL